MTQESNFIIEYCLANPKVTSSVIGVIGLIAGVFVKAGFDIYLEKNKPFWQNKKKPKNKDTSNLAHRERDYRRTQKLMLSLLEQSKTRKEKPDVFVTTLGSPIDILSECVGYTDYQKFLEKTTQNKEWILHRYNVVNDKHSEKHVEELKQSKSSHLKLYTSDKALMDCDETVTNYFVFSDLFAAVTIENCEKILVSFHTNNPLEVRGVKDALISYTSNFQKYAL